MFSIILNNLKFFFKSQNIGKVKFGKLEKNLAIPTEYKPLITKAGVSLIWRRTLHCSPCKSYMYLCCQSICSSRNSSLSVIWKFSCCIRIVAELFFYLFFYFWLTLETVYDNSEKALFERAFIGVYSTCSLGISQVLLVQQDSFTWNICQRTQPQPWKVECWTIRLWVLSLDIFGIQTNTGQPEKLECIKNKRALGVYVFSVMEALRGRSIMQHLFLALSCLQFVSNIEQERNIIK